MKMKIYKIAALFTVAMSMNALAQTLPETTGYGGGGFNPNPQSMPGSFVGQPQRQVGEQPSYAQAGAQNCYDRNHRSNIVGPIQANGQPLPDPGASGHSY